MKQMYSLVAGIFCLLCVNPVSAFEETDSLYVNGLLSAPESSYLSTDNSNLGPSTYYKTSFSVDIFEMSHYWSVWGFGGGFTYSNCTDITTQGFTNLSAYPGKGQKGDSYLISNTNSFTPAEITLQGGYLYNIKGAYFTNASYTALSMLNGDSFAKKFGGADGTEPDWLLLTITGYDNNNNITGSKDIYLADYRSDDPSKDYILKDWQWMDLSSLGNVYKIAFSMSSSDNGGFGMNTPSYFCMDGLKAVKTILLDLANTFSNTSDAFYANGELYLQDLEGATAYLYSEGGQLIRTFTVDSNSYRSSLQAAPGLYLVKVIQGNSEKTFKIAVN